MPTLALIGYPLTHSFSKEYFNKKFSQLSLPDWQYELWSSPFLEEIKERIFKHHDLAGFNVTIPHKVNVLSICDNLSAEADAIGAVNCVRILRTGSRIELNGYNTDAWGFEKSILNWYQPTLKRAIVYGNGGAARAVLYVLKKLEIETLQVVRAVRTENESNIQAMNGNIFSAYNLIINCTPVGMFPSEDEILPIESSWVQPFHQYYDLVYNPSETATMAMFATRGASVKNGLEMLHLQADKAWEIWNGNT